MLKRALISHSHPLDPPLDICIPYKHKTLNRCRVVVGPASTTLGQQQPNFGSASRNLYLIFSEYAEKEYSGCGDDTDQEVDHEHHHIPGVDITEESHQHIHQRYGGPSVEHSQESVFIINAQINRYKTLKN